MVISNRSSISSLVLMLGALCLGCGDDSGDDDTGAQTDAGSTQTDAATSGGTFTSTLVSITAENASAPIRVQHKVSLLNDKGEQLTPPVTTLSGSDGKVTLANRPADGVSIYVEGVGPADVNESTYDTVVLNHNWDSGETLLRISNRGTLQLAESLSDFQADQSRAAVSGAVYWTTDGKLRKGAVGCAKLYIDGKTAPDDSQAQRYVGSTGLPATLAARQSTVKDSGRFYIGNMTKGEHTIKVSLDDGATFIAEKKFFVGKSRAEAASPTKSIIYQIGIDTVAPTNPQPTTCQ